MKQRLEKIDEEKFESMDPEKSTQVIGGYKSFGPTVKLTATPHGSDRLQDIGND